MILNMLEYNKMTRENNIHVMFYGPIWAGGLEGIYTTLQKVLEAEKLPFSLSQAVFSVFVEQVRQILRYSVEEEQFSSETTGENFDAASGVLALGRVEKKYFLQHGHKIKTEQGDKLKNEIDFLNMLDKKELRKYYMEQIKGEWDPKSKEAKIGLIEIARRASSKMEYNFMPLDERHSFFTLFVTIG